MCQSRCTCSDAYKVNAEYASTALTQDLRAAPLEGNGQGIAGLFLFNRGSTEHHKALRAGFDYSVGKASIGMGYERIDPGYETLGAYFFNNDFENITLNCATPLFEDKLNLSFNLGYQRDDLDNQKEQTTKRAVGTVNATFAASERFTLTGMYSNFGTFTNSRVDQFETINDDNLLDNAQEQFDYRQLSQNANLNINYILVKKEHTQQSLNLNYALADVVNEQGGVTRIGDASTFHNANASYTLSFPQQAWNLTTALNATLNTIGREDATTWGPTVNVTKKFLNNTLSTNVGLSYNTSSNSTGRTSVTNLRANLNYVFKEKHSFNLNAIQLFKGLPTGNNQEITATFGYNYSF